MSNNFNKLVEYFLKHYASGGTFEEAIMLATMTMPENGQLNRVLPGMVLDSYRFAVEIIRGEQSLDGAVAMLVHHGAPAEDARILITLSVNILNQYEGQLHYETTEILCKACGWNKEVGLQYIGKEVSCPSCSRTFLIE